MTGNLFNCAAVFVGYNLMNYTIGATSLSTAFERFLAVIHSFSYKKYVEESWNKKQCVLMTLIILLPLMIILGLKIYKIATGFGFGDLTCAINMDEISGAQHLTQLLLCFLGPLIVCGVLHYITLKGIANLQTNKEQNKSLVKARVSKIISTVLQKV